MLKTKVEVNIIDHKGNALMAEGEMRESSIP